MSSRRRFLVYLLSSILFVFFIFKINIITHIFLNKKHNNKNEIDNSKEDGNDHLDDSLIDFASFVSNIKKYKLSGDEEHLVKGYFDKQSVAVGDKLNLKTYYKNNSIGRIELYRVGYYKSYTYKEIDQYSFKPLNSSYPSILDNKRNTIACNWSTVLSINITKDKYKPGMYCAAIIDKDNNFNSTLFTVTDLNKKSKILHIAPYNTYQAYNQYPYDYKLGRSLYYGWNNKDQGTVSDGEYNSRSYSVSFDRPYARNGLPHWYTCEISFIRWAEKNNLDISYATSIDIEKNRINIDNYDLIISSGHDEYYSDNMRKFILDSTLKGKHCAFFAANSMYWRIRYINDDEFACYKTDHDPDDPIQTVKWRQLGRPEGRILGAQYNSQVLGTADLVVKNSSHPLWEGISVSEGSIVKDLIGGEADTVFQPSNMYYSISLAESKYLDKTKSKRIQNTQLSKMYKDSGYIFIGGTFLWSIRLLTSDVIDKFTKNLINMLLK